MPFENSNPAPASKIPVIEYASRSLKQPFSLQQFVAVAVLVLGTILYCVVCVPAYNRSSWPPLDRFSEGLPWLWIFPIPIFTLLMPGGSRSRISLCIYAMLTGAVDAWTYPFVTMNPVPRFDVGMWIANLSLTLPVHLGLTLVITILTRVAYYLAGMAPGLEIISGTRYRRWSRAAVFLGILGMAAIFPFGYRSYMSAWDNALGVGLADADWANQKACIISRPTEIYREANGFEFVSYFDPDSGLPIKGSWEYLWERGYNAEVRHLIAVRGVPTWSLKTRFISDADMVAMLTAKDFKEITAYPCNLSPNVVLFRGGGDTPWGSSAGSNSKDLSIATRHQDFLSLPWLGEENDPAFVRQLAKYPGTYFIKCGKAVVACTGDGWVLQCATDDRQEN